MAAFACLTYSKPITEVVHPIPHDDHPGDAGYARVLHLLVRVAVPVGMAVAVRMAVPVLFRLGFPAVLLGLVVSRLQLALMAVGEGQWGQAGGVRQLVRRLCVVVTRIAGQGGALWPCGRGRDSEHTDRQTGNDGTP